MLGAAIRTCEQCIFPVERDGADGALDGVVVEFDAAIVDEARQAFPARQGVTDGLGELALLADQAEFCTQPRLKGIDSRPAFLLANGATRVGTGPKLAGLGAAAAGIEYGRGGLVRKQPRQFLEPHEETLMQRAQVPGGVTDPIRQR